MSTGTQAGSTPKPALPSARLLASAPNRLMFFVIASSLLLAMTWWAA